MVYKNVRKLMERIIKGNKIAEDAYEIPDGEKYVDVSGLVENIILYHPEGWDDTLIMTADVEEKRFGDFKHFAQHLIEMFEGKGIWITKLALTRIQEIIDEYRR